ncbi:SigE family RNA polymerase sigma factor [Nonomuraea phyllanthi]|uniref:SigE family RNA polymerase sigma factor n=1 Tax=Nonomuraea phyllanthi TaxID=2219224 RepID=A0A5C4VQU7_9ACTN|nr:SigE family RNA polymerase sigma factor [Nonomuraea phyllanthi]KAB8189847.1 SigE family RNA polymerase sigma factor [Nonomuraea phyllanthi]QFY08802.1 SigE family RNA polymerase sigma factor [Nonomuraea phyllanthi]
MADRAIFDDFVVARSDRLLRTAYLLTHDWAVAEDLLQESLAKAWFAWPGIDEPEAYVRRVLVTTYTSWWRRRWRSELPVGALPDEPARDEAGRREELWQAVGRLPARQRAVIVLRFYEDLPVAEVAGILRCQEGTVKSQTAKALAKLRVDESIVKELHR